MMFFPCFALLKLALISEIPFHSDKEIAQIPDSDIKGFDCTSREEPNGLGALMDTMSSAATSGGTAELSKP